jgi:protease-4
MKLLPIILSFFILTGCTLVNVSLTPRTKPLEEKVLEGKGGPKILLIDLDGPISFKEEKSSLKLSTEPSKVAFFREALRKAEGDSAIAGVIVRINSPGGTVSASDTIYHEIMSFKHKKKVPVYAYITELATSGGYYVASSSDRIISSPTAITGSIGVIAMRFNAEELFSKIGVSNETYKSGPKKDFWSPFRSSTPEEQKMLQGIIDRLFARFVSVVYANRQKLLTEPQVRALADGRILTADEALDAKLIDQVSYLDEAIDDMKRTLNIEEARVVSYARPGTFMSNIYSDLPQPGSSVINLVSINAEELSFFSGLQFMYLWNP